MKAAFCRPLAAGSRGADVIAHKRAISRWDPHVYPWQQGFTEFFGPYFTAGVREFQRRHKLTATGKIGKTTHAALEAVPAHDGSGPAFDARAVQLAKDFCAGYALTPEERIREAICDAGWFYYAHRAHTSYSQARPMELRKPPEPLDYADCSDFVTDCHFAGGARDPNNRNFDRLGYTGTLSGSPHSHRVSSVYQLKGGDLIFYGYTTRPSPAFPVGSATHVALYVGLLQGVPSVLSLGHYPMMLYPYNYRSVNHYRSYDVVP